MYPITPSADLLLPKANYHHRRKGLNDENRLSPACREKCFLLTLPFIEPAVWSPVLRLLSPVFRLLSPVFWFSCLRFSKDQVLTRVANEVYRTQLVDPV
jgi:hypothetical protein